MIPGIPIEAFQAGPRTPTVMEKAVFGEDVQLHPVTWLPLQTGVGALSSDQQAIGHLHEMRKWADQGQLWITDLDTAIAGATDAATATDLRKRRENSVEHLALLRRRIIAAAAKLEIPADGNPTRLSTHIETERQASERLCAGES